MWRSISSYSMCEGRFFYFCRFGGFYSIQILYYTFISFIFVDSFILLFLNFNLISRHNETNFKSYIILSKNKILRHLPIKQILYSLETSTHSLEHQRNLVKICWPLKKFHSFELKFKNTIYLTKKKVQKHKFNKRQHLFSIHLHRP